MRLRRVFLPIILSALVLFLVSGAGCDLFSDSGEPAQDDTTPSNGEDTTAIDPGWQAPLLDGQSSPLPSITDVVAVVKPSVVAITTEMVSYGFTTEGGGSGWIIDESGIIVTNAHVVSEADSITVTLDDGRVIPVDMSTVAIDAQTDLAVLKVDVDEPLPAVAVGDSTRLNIGDWVVAIGNSLGFGTRATVGIVSQNDVKIGDELGQPLKLIETDAAINPGNSGGPLVNMAGEVIGINEAKIQDVGVEGVGWAIASADALPIIQELINNGYVVRPWLGVGTETVTPTHVFWYRLAVDEGVRITYVTPGSPADTAGLKAGDVVVAFMGIDVTTDYQMVRGIHTAEIGQTVEIVYWRGNSRYTTQATLIESPPPQG
ncbi:MAG TPA: PDZ domain-containing protein [Dehalococcoidia bacterium]|nr:PDZ domain-containing protein [Dehalococcoidia bacterium]